VRFLRAINRSDWPAILSRHKYQDGRGIYPEAVLQLMKGDNAQRAEVISATCSEIDAYSPPVGLLIPPHQNTKSSIAGLRAIQLMWLRWRMLSPLWHGSASAAFRNSHLSTLIHIAGVTGYTPHPRRSTATYMLTDAVYRAEQVCEVWQRLTSPHFESL
jgi:hypothetical protein